MKFIAIVLLFGSLSSSTYSTYSNSNWVHFTLLKNNRNNRNNKNNGKMCLEENLKNYRDSNGLKLYSAKETTTMAIHWLYKTTEYTNNNNIPTFVLIDLVSMINDSLKKTENYELYIAHVPDRFEDPHFIGSFLINPKNRILSINQICTNPFVKETSLSEYKKNIINLSMASGVAFNSKPLKYVSNPRYYLEFNQF
jgi:hypothetical protein